MKTKKHTNKLRKSSGLFMQLGLVLTLTVVYALFEHKTEINSPSVMVIENHYEDSDNMYPKDIVIERVKAKKSEPIKHNKPFIDKIEISNDPEIIETILPTIPDDFTEQIEDITSQLVEVDFPEELEPDSHLILNVQEVPIYPGCEKGTRAEKKKCFEKKVSKFISRNFNSEIGYQLGLTSGNQKIYVNFLITKKGEIEIVEARANHKRLRKEGERVVELLPNMIPGKQDGRPVNVSYFVPISFNIE